MEYVSPVLLTQPGMEHIVSATKVLPQLTVNVNNNSVPMVTGIIPIMYVFAGKVITSSKEPANNVILTVNIVIQPLPVSVMLATLELGINVPNATLVVQLVQVPPQLSVLPVPVAVL